MQSRVAVVIPAKDESDRIRATVRAARQLPMVDFVLVVDDGSRDNTLSAARKAGAAVVRHRANRGKAAAMKTGADAIALRERERGEEPHAVLFLDADLGESAAECAGLIAPVVQGEVDMTIAYLPPQAGAGGHGFVTGFARRWIERLTGWRPQQPLSGQRCLSREALDAAFPLAHGWGVEVGLTIDLLTAGYTVQEIPCDLRHRATANNLAGYLHRAGQYADVVRAVLARRVRRMRMPSSDRLPRAGLTPSPPGVTFNAYR